MAPCSLDKYSGEISKFAEPGWEGAALTRVRLLGVALSKREPDDRQLRLFGDDSRAPSSPRSAERGC